jgi:homoserine/homoserine lactone efflux protein
MNPELWLAYLIACIVISLSPGAGAVNTMSNGMVYGVRHSLPAIMGLQLGYGAQFIIVGVGLGALLASSTTLFDVIKWLGVLYLVWLGIQKWRQPSLQITSDSRCSLDYRKRFWQATLVNLTNPKATVFLVALLPQFLDLSQPQLPQFTIMTITGLSVDIVVMLGYATLATTLARWWKEERHQRRINRVFAGMFILAAGLMASYQRQ